MDRDTINGLREAKANAEAEGRTDERLNVTLALYEIGISGWGPGVATDTLKAWLADPAAAPKSASRVALEQFADSGVPKVRRGGEPASNQFGTFSVHPASDKQVAFVRRLVATKDWQGHRDTAGAITIPDPLDGISKKAASALIDRLMACPDKPADQVTQFAGGHTPRPVANKATDKQMEFLRNLIAQRDYFSLGEADRRKVDMLRDNPTMIPSAKGASDLIEVLKGTAYAKGDGTGRDVNGGQTVALELGMYRKADGTMYRVYPARQSDRILAKRLVPNGDGGWEFEYAGMAQRFVKADERMTLEEAKAWGAQFGTCCVCAALLTDPTSVAAGIGPICKGKV